MGRSGKGKSKDKAKAEDDDDALLNAAIAENRVLKEEEASAAAATAAAASAITAAFNKLPVFTIANKDGQPLEFKIGKRLGAVFYADVAAAKTQLKEAQKQKADCDLIAVGLGSAYRLSCDGKGIIVPGVADLMGAGAPEGCQPIGQELPLFACTKLGRYMDEGLVTPLFMSYDDCAAAVAEASIADESEDPAQITALTLQSVIEQLTDPSSPAFSFVSPSASVKHIEHYVGAGVYMRHVEAEPEPPGDDEDAPPPLAESAA